MVLFEMKSRQPTEIPAEGAARRKALWSAKRERLWMASVYVCSFVFIVLATAGFIYEKSASALSPATEVTFVDGQVVIPLNQVMDGDLHRYLAKEGGLDVRFWLYQKPDGKIATLFDACDLRAGWLLQERNRGRLQKLCGTHQPAIGRNAGRLQPNSTISRSHKRLGHHQGNRHGGRATLVRTEITCSSVLSTNRFDGRSAASFSQPWQ